MSENTETRPESVVIVGAGAGLSAALARLAAANGLSVALGARDTAKLAGLCTETGARAFPCDVADPASVAAFFEAVDGALGTPDWVVFNPSKRSRGAVAELDPEAVRDGLLVTAYGGFLVGQQAARRMQKAGRGSIFFTGASASVKGYAQSAPFAMGKFALRGLAESMARELQPQNIHVAHFVIDGGIRAGDDDPRAEGRGDDGLLLPEAIAETYWHVYRQHRSAWTLEVALRPWCETF